MIRIVTVLFFCSLVFCIGSGCSESAPDMASVRPNLALDIFELVKRGKHQEAAVKIRKLRELDPTNVYLPELESVEISNAELQKVDSLLKADKRKEATAMLQTVIRRKGLTASSVRTAEKLRDVIRMERLADMILSPRVQMADARNRIRFVPASGVLKSSVEEFVLLSQKWNVPASLRNKAVQRLSLVPELQEEENHRASVSLEAFAAGLIDSGNGTILAVRLYADGTKAE